MSSLDTASAMDPFVVTQRNIVYLRCPLFVAPGRGCDLAAETGLGVLLRLWVLRLALGPSGR